MPAVPALRRPTGFALALPAIVLLATCFVGPVLALLTRSVSEPVPGLQNFAEILTSATYARVLANTFLVASLVTLVTTVVAYPVAWTLTVLPGRWPALVMAVVILSMWTNLLTRTYAWMVLLQQTGLINRVLIAIGVIDAPLVLVNNLVGVTIGMVYIMLPFMVLPLYGVLKTLDPAILQAASLCGASRGQVFRRVLIPLSLPGIASGGLMIFVMSLGYFVTPALLGGTSNMMLAELIAQLVQSLVNWGLGSAAAFVLLVVTLSLYALQLKLLGRPKGAF